jgi:Tfp pilus assembly protein FimT
MVELLVVLVIGLTVVILALPNMLNVVAIARMRGNISTLSGAFQATRMISVKENRLMTLRFSNPNNGIMAYVKQAADTSPVTRTDIQVELEAPITRYTAIPVGGPSSLTSTELGFTPATGDASFNTRGLPCTYSSPSCTNQGFIYYFRDTRRAGNNGWAAVSVSPAGRIKKWFWNGTVWGE